MSFEVIVATTKVTTRFKKFNTGLGKSGAFSPSHWRPKKKFSFFLTLLKSLIASLYCLPFWYSCHMSCGSVLIFILWVSCIVHEVV